VHVVLPDSVDDPGRPSGGNRYDRRVCEELARAGWAVHEWAAAGAWPRPSAADRKALHDRLAEVPAGSLVLIDGLVACGVPEVVEPAAERLRMVVLVHLPLAHEGASAADLDPLERRALRAAAAVVATSAGAARHLAEHHGLARVDVAAPGVDPAPLAPGGDGGTQLLCVAAVTRRKGQDLLIAALDTLPELEWACECVGAVVSPPENRNERVHFVGPKAGAELDATYGAADLLVLPSRAETFGMVVTEAIARGIPVLATAVGGVPEALGDAGLLVPPEDVGALAAALRRWLTEPDLRAELRTRARQRRATLPGWDVTARHLIDVLERL
jgi:glycosyltransferase involved in cell wall biosynthesis